MAEVDPEFRKLVREEMEKSFREGCLEHNIKPGFTYNHIHCPACGCSNHEVRNYDMMWGDGDVHCGKCGRYLRMFDSG